MTREPIPDCPQPETPIRERAWSDAQKAAHFTAEEVLEMASVLLHNPKPREWKTRAGNMLTAYADTLSKPATHPQFANAESLADWLETLHECYDDGAVGNRKWEAAQVAAKAIRATLSKPADSGRVDAPTDEQIIAVCRAAGIRWIEPDEDDCGFPGGFDITYMTGMRNLFVALAAQERGDAASPMVEFSVDFMDGWLEGESEEVLRNWKRVRQAATRPATAASPAGVPDGMVLVPWEPTPVMLAIYEHIRSGSDWQEHVFRLTKRQLNRHRSAYKAMVAAAPSAPTGE